MSSRFTEIDLSKLRRISIQERGGSVRVDQFVAAQEVGPEIDRLLAVVPNLLSGAEFKTAVSSVAEAAVKGRAVVAMFGAHVVKCGLSRLMIDLMRRGIVTAVATNGAGAIHDFEIAAWGKTSEDVAARIRDGTFGMCLDTADAMNEAVTKGRGDGLGFGESIGRALAEMGAPHADASILASAYELGVPATVHVAVGTDIVHEHASADGAAIGETSLRDFRILAAVVAGLDHGVVLNIGSAVILPEVFLKALAVARNLGHAGGPFTAISMDMNEPYRAMVNVVGRPTTESGVGIALRGRHEILFPLFWAAVVREVGRMGDEIGG